MVTKKPISWFLTDRGRKFSFTILTGAGVSFTVARFVPNTIGLTKYTDFVRYYSNGQPAELPNELRERSQKCMDILNLPEIHRKMVAPFSVFGYDLFHAGTCYSKYGVSIGIPVNFTYKSFADIEKDAIQVNQKYVNWNSEIAKKLADAMVLPEKVQQFAICREILMTQNYKVMLESTYPFMCVLFMYSLSSYINQKLNLYAAPKILRGCLYTLVGMFGLGTYFLAKDVTEVYYEGEVDKKLCELGPEFIESGVIFYDKLLQRNQALRELMGSEGERKYSKLGNENYIIRQRHLALVHRKQFFEDKLKEIANANTMKK